MLDQLNEEQIHRLFREKKREDARMAPSFERIWYSAVVTKQNKRMRLFRQYLVAASFVLITVGTTLFVKEQRSRRQMEAIAAMVEWESPTRSLSILPGAETFAYPHVPASPATWLEYTHIATWKAPTQSLMPLNLP